MFVYTTAIYNSMIPQKTSSPLSSKPSKPETPLDWYNPFMGGIRVNWTHLASSPVLQNLYGKAFNPSLLPLPSARGNLYIMAGRLPHQIQKINDEDYYRSNVIICMAHIQDREFRCLQEPKIVDIDQHVLDLVLRKPKDKVKWYKFIGAEDPRVFWGPHGEPLLVYGMNSQRLDRLRSNWVTDLRTVLPDLDGVLATDIQNPPAPIFVSRQIELGALLESSSNGLGGLEKNWSPFTYEGKLFFHTRLHPRRIYTLDRDVSRDAKPAVHRVEGLDEKSFDSCFKRLFPVLSQDKGVAVHQASNLLRLTLCSLSGDPECATRSDTDTVLLQFFHVKHHKEYRYRQYIMIWDAKDSKFSAKAILGPLLLPGQKPMDVIQYITTVNYYHTENSDKQGLDHGYLDTPLMISIGYEDRRGEVLMTRAQELLNEMKYC